MCGFCDTIHDFEEFASENLDYISFDKDKRVFWLHANSGCKYYQGLIYDIKYCPYCARELKE